MKKIVTLLLISLALFGCKKGDTTQKEESIVGTIWVADFGTSNDHVLKAIEFTGEGTCMSYSTDENLGMDSKQFRGTYKRNGNSLEMNLEIYYMGSYNAYEAEINDNLMTVKTKLYLKLTNEYHYYTYRFMRKK